MVAIFVLKKIYPLCKLFDFNRLSHLSLLNGKNNGLQQMIDKKNTFSILSSFYPEQILSAWPLKIVRSRTKFVKLRQTILIC